MKTRLSITFSVLLSLLILNSCSKEIPEPDKPKHYHNGLGYGMPTCDDPRMTGGPPAYTYATLEFNCSDWPHLNTSTLKPVAGDIMDNGRDDLVLEQMTWVFDWPDQEGVDYYELRINCGPQISFGLF